MEEQRRASDIRDPSAEAGVVATAILKPDFTFYSDHLEPNHFTDKQNAYIYYAICELAKRGVSQIDAYAINNMLNMRKATMPDANTITIDALNEFIDLAPEIARSTLDDYMALVDNVLELAFRRNTFKKLQECESLCFNSDVENIEQKIYGVLDEAMTGFSVRSEIPQMKDVADSLWEKIEAKQNETGYSGIPTKFPTLNMYCTVEAGELITVCAPQKVGKSIMLLNLAMDMLRQDKSVLYIDSELNETLFFTRLISHLTGIEFMRVKTGRYTEEEHALILEAKEWLKSKRFTHHYLPVFDEKSLYTITKKVSHTQGGLDVLFVDYIKSSGAEGDAFATYAAMGRITDLIKNTLCGAMKIAGVAAAQTTDSGRIADSAKIARNSSTILILQRKTDEELQRDGEGCGTHKLTVRFNRNGPQMSEGEYIDLDFDGDRIRYEEAPRQHEVQNPY